MSNDRALDDATFDLVLANKILAQEGGLDAWGHVSVRHPHDPGRFLLSVSRSPELVTAGDIVVHGLDGEAVEDEPRPLYYERFIHAGVYRANPAVQSVIHSHADDVLPFALTREPLRVVMIAAKVIGNIVPVWDIADRFGDGTDLLVSDLERAADLAALLGENAVTLMRGHGFVAAGPTLLDAVTVAIYLPRNAHILMNALRLGSVNGLSPAEVSTGVQLAAESYGRQRAWEYWSKRVGVPYRPGGFARSSALLASRPARSSARPSTPRKRRERLRGCRRGADSSRESGALSPTK
jgi:HCOMODA/2-hydroxy-3-carboxy-muconic semialdehyde decarboxylase